jgi:DNA-binding CsgD family transcriptional regulator
VTLSLLDPKLQKRLLALHSATDVHDFLKSAVQLIVALIPCDMVLSQVHRVGGDGRCPTTFWDRNCSVLGREDGPACLVGNRHLSILAISPGEAPPPLPGRSRQEHESVSFVPSVQGVAMRSAVALFFWNETLDIVDLLLAPHRGFHLPRISNAEMATVQALYPHIEAARKRVCRVQAEAYVRRDLERFVSTLPLPTVLLDSQFTSVYNNSAGRRAAALWSGTDPQIKLTSREFRMPADLLSVLAEMRNEQTACRSRARRERLVEHPRLQGFKARLSLRHGRRSDPTGQRFVVRFETDRFEGSDKLATLTRLSPRERELALMVNEGKSNQEIADALGRQLNTVKSELHSVFRKLEIPSRARLIALLR